MPERHGSHRRETEDHHERPADPAEASDRPLEDKDRDPGTGEDPHHALNRPVGEPDETADSDPYGD